MPDNPINVAARRRANEVCAPLAEELTSLASAYGEASKAYHELWAKVYSKERARGQNDKSRSA